MNDLDSPVVRTPGRGTLDVRFVLRTAGSMALPVWFLVSAVLTTAVYVRDDLIGIDTIVYREAAVAALSGNDPWAVTVSGYAFAGPPPTLLLYLPFALLPIAVSHVLATLIGVGATVFAVRRLRLPLWWVIFPPLFEGVLVGNPDPWVLALLLLRGPAAGLAVVGKVYAMIPLLLQRRSKAVLLAVAVCLLSAPWWGYFLSSAGSIEATLDDQSLGVSAFGTIVMVPTIAALWILRRDGAEWLIVPALWPHTQLHYAAMSLTVVSRYPIAAAIIGLSTPLAPALAVMVIAIQVGLARRAAARTVDASP